MPSYVEIYRAPQGLNVRTQPRVLEDTSRITVLREGAVLELAGRDGDWVRLLLARTDTIVGGRLFGWVNSYYTRPAEAPDGAEADTPPEPTFEVRDVADDLPKHSDKTYRKRDLGDLEAHLIHHTATAKTATPQAIANYHVSVRDWPAIGYTFFVTADGEILQTNPLGVAPHATRGHDHRYLSTALVGNFNDDDRPTDAQIEALRWLHHHYIPDRLGRTLPLLGHKEGDEQITTCPGNTWDWHDAIGA